MKTIGADYSKPKGYVEWIIVVLLVVLIALCGFGGCMLVRKDLSPDHDGNEISED